MNHLAYSRPGRAGVPVWISGLAALTLLGGVACTAGVRSSSTGTGGNGGVTGATGAAGSGGKAGSSGTGATQGLGGAVGLTGPGGNPDAAACQQMEIMFTPTNPTVFILVDRSGSEFGDGCVTGTNHPYNILQSAVEQVVESLQAQVRFGLGVFVGDHSTGTCALDWDTVPIDLNNSDAIAAKYNSLGQVAMASEGNCKADTPATQAIPMVKATLQADTGTGPKYVLFATDGETDFCDDGNALCPADAVTYQVQDLYAAGYGTLVIGTASNLNAIDTTVLQNLANAGAGQGVIIPPGSGAATTADFLYQCNGSMTTGSQWMSLYTAAGRTGMTSVATYSATAGTAPVYAPTTLDAQSLVTQISAAINSIPRSCTFDLSTFKIDTTKLREAEVYLVDSTSSRDDIPLDPTNTNGWDMTSSTELQLFGSWCDKLRLQTTTDIKFNFPCDIIIIIN